jgi:hypothetical protein
MRALSEDYFCAGWSGGLEYSLWEAISDSKRKRGHFGGMPPTERAMVMRIAELAGGWWVRSTGEPERFVPMAEWEVMYTEWEAR